MGVAFSGLMHALLQILCPHLTGGRARPRPRPRPVSTTTFCFWSSYATSSSVNLSPPHLIPSPHATRDFSLPVGMVVR